MDLTPYVPRVVLQWAEDYPDARYRSLEGSLAFCDLSGFTAMSEKLAVLGRLGAEELADVLNLLFAALLDDAASYGGSLLKYGGDAVLLFFEGDDHAARAAAAVHTMRATLRRLGRVKTSRGYVRVRMSVGVHTGAFDFFLVGSSHRELIVTGPGTTECCDMETAADAGEILLSPATAAALPPSCVGERKGAGLLLARKPRARSEPPTPINTIVDATQFVPVGLREHVGRPGVEGEHRHIGVGFISFGGLDHLLADRGPETTGAELDALIRLCQDAFDRHGVTFLYADVYGDGGKVFFVTGAPVAHADNEERLLHASREINDAYAGAFHLHTGLNRGYVFAGDIGSKFRRTYTVLGDAVNTAARVMASCSADSQIRAMPPVLDLAATRFEADAQPPFAAKGKALPLETFAVGAPLGARRADVSLPLIGRDAQLAQLHAALEGAGSLVVVTGPAGIGKSRLVEDFAIQARADGVRVFTTFAEAYQQSTPYFALATLLQTWLGPDATASDFIASATAGLDSESGQVALTQRVVDLWREAVGARTAWIIENADLLDEASAVVVRNLATTFADAQLRIVAVGREAVANRALPADETLTLDALARDDAVALARIADPHLLPHDAGMLADRSGGNPLFLRQLVAAGVDSAETADTVETAVAARIDTLPPDAREVLRAAAVLGGRFERELLRDVLGNARVDLAQLAEFVGTERDEVFFRQSIFREVAASELTFRRRKQLHHAAARAIDARPGTKPLERLSLHFHEAGAWDESWDYSWRAGAAAFTTVAKAIAAVYFERALEAGRSLKKPGEDLGHVAAQLGLAWSFAGRVERARAAYALGRRLAPKSGRARAMLEQREGALAAELGDANAALRWFRRSRASLPPETIRDGDHEAMECGIGTLAGASTTKIRMGRLASAIADFRDAQALAMRSGSPWLVGTVENIGVLLAYAQGDVEGAAEHARRALDAMRADGRAPGSVAIQLSNLAAVQFVLGDLPAAVAYGLESYEVATKQGNAGMAAEARSNLAEALIEQGQWTEASRHVEEAAAVFNITGSANAAFTTMLDARLRVRQGDPTDLDEATCATLNELGVGDAAMIAKAEYAVASGDLATARGLLDEHAGLIAAQPLRLALHGAIDSAAIPVLLDEATATGARVSAVLLRVLAGGSLAADADARALGIVDVPCWAKPSWHDRMTATSQ